MIYYTFVSVQLLSHPSHSEPLEIGWALERDKSTRAKAMSLHNEGWPWGAAILEAALQLGVLWSRVGLNAASPAVAVLGSHAAAHGDAISNTTAGAACSCPRFNSKQGCVSGEMECPFGFDHTCALCGFRNHSLMTCNKRDRAPPPPKVPKQRQPFTIWPGAQEQKGDKCGKGGNGGEGGKGRGRKGEAQAQVLTRFLPSVGYAR